MQDKVCQRCGRELTQSQRWRHCKYCSRSCFHDAQFGEKIEWHGVWVRPGQMLEVLKLYRKGLSEAEAQRAVGADYKVIRRIRDTPEFANFLPDRFCLFCGESLSQKPMQNKYCSRSCKYKARYDRRNLAKGRETRRVDHVQRSRAIDLYVRGLDAGSIARYLDVSTKSIRRWVYAPPIKRGTEICPELKRLLPLKHRLDGAKNVEEWLSILHDENKGFGPSGLVVLVTERLHGGGAPGRYVSIVTEKLKQTISEGSAFAFCNVLHNAVTVIEWKDGNFHLTRTLKTSGTFVWPGAHLGDFLTVTKDAFTYLLAYQKSVNRYDEFA